jgi:putative FmdB family regulatory protein
MPTYEYRCKSCGEHLEVVQSFKDDPLTVCPQCEGELRKVFSPIGISFKGSGFYKTDSRSGSGSKAAESKSSETKSAETKSSETKASESKASESSSSSSASSSSSDSSSSKSSDSKAASAS